MNEANPTAAVLIIGNEILSGRTQDVNLQFLARRLAALGVRLAEARVIPDLASVIIANVNELRARYDHLITTGGIGPTHDDITSECVAAALGLPWEPHPEAWALLQAHYAAGEFNAARQRMATMPRGAKLIANPVSFAPGFSIANVHVLAGVPKIMQAMFDDLAPQLKGGKPIVMRVVHAADIREGQIATALAAIAARYPAFDLGSYPYSHPSARGVVIVAKGTDVLQAEAAIAEVSALIAGLGYKPVAGEPA